MGGVKKAIIAADFHVPFFHEKSLQSFLKEIKENNFDEIIIAGDFLDLYSVSRFDNAPTRADDINYELTIAREILSKIRNLTDKKIIYITGNHEQRLESFLSRGKNRALYNLACLKIENLLDFDKYKITKIEDIYHLNDNVIITHGSKCGVNAPHAEALSYMKSGISGHTHRELTFKRRFLDTFLEWHSLPCMCNIKDAKYATKFSHAWTNGYGSLTFDDTFFDIKIIRVPNK